jgi:hypothetical protein
MSIVSKNNYIMDVLNIVNIGNPLNQINVSNVLIKLRLILSLSHWQHPNNIITISLFSLVFSL